MRQIRTLGYIRRAHLPDDWSDIADYTDQDYQATLARRRIAMRRKANGQGSLGIAENSARRRVRA